MTEQKKPQHPIRLEQVFFTRSSVIAVPEHAPDDTRQIAPPQNEIKVNKLTDGSGRYNVSMQTHVNQEMEKSSPYCIDMECIAILYADDSLTEEEAMRGVTITGHSVLFGAIREAVAWLTGRQPYGPLMLGLSVLQSAPRPESIPGEQ